MTAASGPGTSRAPRTPLAVREPYKVGRCYLFRLVTFSWVGKVVCVGSQEIIIDGASWVADTGRFHVAIRDGLESMPESEIEYVGDDVTIGRGAVVDAVPYNHPLPKESK